MSRRRRSWFQVAAIALFVVIAVLSFSLGASADYLVWDGPTTYADGTSIPDNQVRALKYYVRTNEPNMVSTVPDATGKYYLGETTGGTVYWPADNNVDGRIREGETLTFTITAGYRDSNGAWQESRPSVGLPRSRPFVSKGPTKEPTGSRWSPSPPLPRP